jgi:hypothetical protein
MDKSTSLDMITKLFGPYKKCNIDGSDDVSSDEADETSVNDIEINDNDCNFIQSKNTNCTTEDYIDFLNDKVKTNNAKTYTEVSRYTDLELENDHRYIQWIFPTTTQSSCADGVPIISIGELQNYIAKDHTIINKLLSSYNMMIKHWGLDGVQCLEKIELLNGHDALRFSRMLQSLVYHGRKDLATLAYELVSQHIGGQYSILNPLMYYGTTLENMVKVGYLDNIVVSDLEKFSVDAKLMDVWKYHLLKAFVEYDEFIKDKI